jgi:hypothetical protein
VAGPGAYEVEEKNKLVGGYIPKGDRMNTEKKLAPGPGAYKIESIKSEVTNPKGNYPPIFGSGSSRFQHHNSSLSETVKLAII